MKTTSFLAVSVAAMASSAMAAAVDLSQVEARATCSKSLPSGQEPGNTYDVSFKSKTHDSDRSYRVHIPLNYKSHSSVKAIFSYHGGTKDSAQQESVDKFNAQQFGGRDNLVVYPQGVDGWWQGVPGKNIDDLTFTEEILNSIEKLYCIDKSRIYATGKSDGGGFVGKLACDSKLSSHFAAFAPVSGAFYTSDATCSKEQAKTVVIQCNPNRKHLPFLEIHGGSQDKTISYTGGTSTSKGHQNACLPDIMHYVKAFAARDGLDANKPNKSQFQSDTTKYEWGGGLVSHLKDDNIGHVWPRTSEGASFDGSQVILDFFAKYTL